MGLALEKLPHWPRMMKRATAAAFCDLSEAEFEREVAAGRLPMPVKFGSADHWSQQHLEDAVQRLTGEVANDWRKSASHYAPR
jgi:hypothetical protein